MGQPATALDDSPTPDADSVLALLSDDDARDIFEATAEPRTIPELAEECELPRSTAYRKTKRLVEVGLLEPMSSTVGDTGTATAYRRAVEGVEIEIGNVTTIEFLD